MRQGICLSSEQKPSEEVERNFGFTGSKRKCGLPDGMKVTFGTIQVKDFQELNALSAGDVAGSASGAVADVH